MESTKSTALPTTSAWAQKYGCREQVKRGEIEDTTAGYVYDRGRQNPGTKQSETRQGCVLIYPNCKDGTVVADVVRIDKGDTERLEPKVTEALVKLMLSEKGSQLQKEN